MGTARILGEPLHRYPVNTASTTLGRLLAALALVFAFTSAGRTMATATTSDTPRGKGVFVRNLASSGDPERFAALVQSMGLSWVAVEILWQETGEPDRLHGSRLAEYAPALLAAGVDIWVWLYPAPDGVTRAIERVRAAYERVPEVRGVIIDPEKPFYSLHYAEPAARLMAGLAALGRPIGVTTYPVPAWHPVFPWAAFVKYASFGVPQVYTDRGGAYAARAISEYKALGFPVVIVALGASSTHSGAEMTRLASYVPRPRRALVWWALDHLDGSGANADKRREAVAGVVV